MNQKFLGAVLLSFGVSLSGRAVPMTAILQIQEKVTMEALANVVMNSNSPLTRAYNVDEIRQIAGPNEVEYQETLRQIQNEGFDIVQESATRLSIVVSADSRLFEKVFSTQFSESDTGERWALKSPKIPSHLRLIKKLSGFGEVKRRHHAVSPANAEKGLKPTPTVGLKLSQIAELYGFQAIYDAGYNGAGQTIAIATYGDVNLKAIEAAYSYYQLSPMTTVEKVNFNGVPKLDDNSAMETSLDAEFAGMIAPGSHVMVYTSASNDDAGELAMFTKILDDGLAHVINYSWGGCEAELDFNHGQDMNSLFARAVAQGVNITVASGDNGSNTCGVGLSKKSSGLKETPKKSGKLGLKPSPILPVVNADWPAASPFVIGVGGTTISNRSQTPSEVAWSNSGGGVSTLWAKPSWQNGMSSFGMRAYPDVAFNADPDVSPEPVYLIYKGQQGWAPMGGTSMASPQWAGLITLINAARVKEGKSHLGFLNPILYSMGSTGIYSVLRDITKGTNGAYQAGTGFDAVTGLGSPKADNFFSYMINH